MRPISILQFALASLAAVMVGCGPAGEPSDSATNGKETPKLSVGLVFDSGGRGDKSFNDSAWAGLERAINELGIEHRVVESKSEKDYDQNLAAMADQGCDLVFAVGLGMESALKKVAATYPKTKFAIVDGLVEADNVRSLRFKEEEGSFLAGYLAALMSESGRVGFVGGKEIPLIKKFHAGFVAGAKTARPDVVVLPEKYTGSWDNTDTGKLAAKALFADGADVVYHAAGKAGLGVFAAAEEAMKYAIGVDSDQDYLAPGVVLTSMVKRVDESVFQTVKDVLDGKFESGVKVYDLASGGVGLSEMKHTKDQVGAERLAKVEEVSAKIKSGEISVPSTPEKLAEFLQKSS